MIVVAGPSGSGKSLFFPVRRMAAHAFNVDDRAALLHGGYGGIPAVIRAQAQRECEAFVLDQITQRHTFAVETTLRSDAALRQAAIARSNGLRTALVYVCTQDVHENVKRVAERSPPVFTIRNPRTRNFPAVSPASNSLRLGPTPDRSNSPSAVSCASKRSCASRFGKPSGK